MNNLLKLADLIDALQPEQFDLETWQQSGDTGCGTVACAIGWACLSKEFPNLSLMLTSDYRIVPMTLSLEKVTLTGWSAVEDYFDLLPSIAIWLFGPDCYSRERRTPAVVANRIRAYASNPKKFEGMTCAVLINAFEDL